MTEQRGPHKHMLTIAVPYIKLVVQICLLPSRLSCGGMLCIWGCEQLTPGAICIFPTLGAKDKWRKKHINTIFTGMCRDFGGDFVYVFFSPKRNDPPKHANKYLTPSQSRDSPRNLFMFMCSSFPDYPFEDCLISGRGCVAKNARSTDGVLTCHCRDRSSHGS